MPVQPPPLPPASTQNFDLARLPAADADQGVDFHLRLQNCGPGEPGEIVVCAKSHERNRLEAPVDNFHDRKGLPKAEVDLGGGKALGISADSSAMGGGAVSKRIMITGKIKF